MKICKYCENKCKTRLNCFNVKAMLLVRLRKMIVRVGLIRLDLLNLFGWIEVSSLP